MKLEITAVHFDLDKKLKRYATKHIGKLDRYISGRARAPLMAHVVLTENDGAAGERYVCEVTLNLPQQRVFAQVATPNSILGSIDLAEAKIKAQLLKYKTKHKDHQQHQRRILRRFGWRDQ